MDITMEVFKSIVAQGPLVGFLFYLYIQNEKKIDKKDNENAALNKELRESIEQNLNKTNDAIVNNTMALNAIREAFKNA